MINLPKPQLLLLLTQFTLLAVIC